MKSLIERYGKVNLIMVGVTIVTTIIAIIMGIYAVQTAMKMKLSFSINPTVKVQIQTSETGADGTWTTLFNNASATGEIANGWTLNGNTLTCTSAMTELAGAQYFKITNCNTDAHLLTNISVNDNAGTNYVATKNSGTVTTAQIVSLSKISFDFQKVAQITVNNNNSVISSTSNNIITYNGSYYAPIGEQISFTFAGATHYQTPTTVTVNGNQQTLSGGILTLTLSADCTINVISGGGEEYGVSTETISGMTFASSNATTAQYGTAYTFTLTTSSTTYQIQSVTYTIAGGSPINITGSTITGQTSYTYTIPGNQITGAIVISATAVNEVTITFNANGGSGGTTQTLTPGSTYSMPTTAPTNGSKTFLGWAESASGAATWDTAVTQTASTSKTWYAQWATGSYYIYSENFVKDSSTNYVYKMKMGTYNGIPVKWIVLSGMTSTTNSSSTYENGDTMFLNNNTGSHSLSANGGTLKIGTSVVVQIFVLSEYAIEKVRFNASTSLGNNFFYTASSGTLTSTHSNIYTHLHETLMPKMIFGGLSYNVQTMTIAKTTWNNGSQQTYPSGSQNSNAQYFFLGCDDRCSASAPRDSFALTDYLGNGTTDSDSYKVAKSITDPSSTSLWWLRSGYYSRSDYAYYVDNNGFLSSRTVAYTHCAVRPSFVLNLA